MTTRIHVNHLFLDLFEEFGPQVCEAAGCDLRLRA